MEGVIWVIIKIRLLSQLSAPSKIFSLMHSVYYILGGHLCTQLIRGLFIGAEE